MPRNSSVVEGEVVLADGTALHYALHTPRAAAATPRPTLLLLRPLGGGLALWGEFLERLAATRPVLALAHRGCAGSAPARRHESTRRLAADALEVLDRLELSAPIDVFGISLGGMVATRLALQASPNRVRRMVLASCAARGLVLSAEGARRAARLAAGVLTTRDPAAAALAREVLSRRFRRAHPRRTRAIVERVRRAPGRRTDLARLLRAALRHDVRRLLPQLTLPVLVLAGTRDHLVPAHTQRALAQALPDARLELVAGAGHDLTLEAPRETAQRVAAFLDGGDGLCGSA